MSGENAEGARRDLGVEGALIAGADLIERHAVIGDQPREHVDPADRALGVGDRGESRFQCQALGQLDDVDTASFQHRALVVEGEGMHRELVDFLSNRRLVAGEKAGTHAKRPFAQAEIEGCRLDLAGRDRIGRQDGPAVLDQGLQLLAGQDAAPAGRVLIGGSLGRRKSGLAGGAHRRNSKPPEGKMPLPSRMISRARF